MKLHHLRDFVAVAQALSVRGAARQLGLAQPALSRSMRELEAELGAVLLERHARGVVLTPIGEAFLVRASAALQEVRRGGEEVAQMLGETTGSVAIGVSSAAWLALVPQVHAAFRQRFPQVRLQLVEGFFRTMEPRLLDGSLDFFVGPRPERPAGDTYHVELLFPNERCVVGRHGHPLAKARSLAELVGAEWILTGVRERMESEFEEVFTDHGLTPPRALTKAESTIGVAALLAASDALAVLPRQWVKSPLLSPTIVPFMLAERFAAPDIVRISRAGLPLTPAADYLSTLIERQAVATAGDITAS